MENILFVVLIIIAILIVGSCLIKTSFNKRKRIITGIVLILSVFLYPMFVPFFGGIGGLDGVVSLMAFHFILLVGGLLTLIVGFFTKSEYKKIDKQTNNKQQ
ncbi:hypothetical protein E2K98_13075 [Bacillus salipaludis]|uniref:Uncharacterized protein n=1 Tax=Bacillus salipaludis TaxID=2547811 RepID=A0A4R5VTM1_9BACI|nr:hypothetical protein [Bacillus salipaludis]TDK61810.1 hypothetical protein E2K98_13075 [Bacillus salipaludis]